MSDLKPRKEQNINFRVEEDVKEKIVELARRENLNLSAFMKKVVLEYPDLVESSRQLENSNSIKFQALKISKSLSDKLDSYKAVEFEKLFSTVKGKEYKGKQIRTESDLLRIFARESTIKLKQDDKEIELDINNITLEEEKKSKLGVYAIIVILVIIAVATIFYFRKKAN
jgi:dGTP triphosphohydrolase